MPKSNQSYPDWLLVSFATDSWDIYRQLKPPWDTANYLSYKSFPEKGFDDILKLLNQHLDYM
jgi:hypothetical protein